MKAYLVITGSIFGLIVVAHVLRLLDEGAHLLTEPLWVLLTLVSAALAAWGWTLFRRSLRS